MRFLGIDTSCDETAIACVAGGKKVLGEEIFSQAKDHAQWQGIVPENAARGHVYHINTVYERMKLAMAAQKIDRPLWDAVAVSYTPGLVGSLSVGLSFARAISLIHEIPLVGVNHIAAHIYSVQLEHDVAYPYLALVVSGGHTMIVWVRDPLDYDILGTTIDDAVGEAFDKVARLVGLPYPGGPELDKEAQGGDYGRFPFPSVKIKGVHNRFNFSFSGLKTWAFRKLAQTVLDGQPSLVSDFCASFQHAAISSLLAPFKRAIDEKGAKRIAICGGVAANSLLRKRIHGFGVETFCPPMKWCGDNAAMVAGLGYHALRDRGPSDFFLPVVPRMVARGPRLVDFNIGEQNLGVAH